MAWQKNGTPDTLGSAGDTMTISDLTTLIFNEVLAHSLQSGEINCSGRLGSGSIDTGSNYTSRFAFNETADGTEINQNNMDVFGFNTAASWDSFAVAYIINIASEEKLVICMSMARNVVGAGAAPQRSVQVSKWVNTANQFDNAQSLNIGTGSYVTDSNFSMLGTD